MTWKRVSSPLVPEVRVAAQDGRLTVAVAGTEALQPSASLVAARTRVLARELTRFPATVDLSETALGASPLRLWLHVRWQDAHGRTILQETPFSAWLGGTPPEAPAVAEHLDLAALEAELAADALRIRIPFEMPQDGKATLLICDAEGNRIRNLVNGQPFAKGPQMVEWDGRREDGTVAEPGTYTVRTVTHPGLSARIVGRFANGGEKLWEPYGPNHVPFVTLCARGDRVLAASLFTEGGSSMVIMDLEGRRTNAFANSWNLGNAALHAVSGEAQWYAFREKRETAKAPDGTEKETSLLQIFAYSWETPEPAQVRLRGGEGERADGFRRRDATALAGAPSLTGVAKAGELTYVGDRLRGGVALYRLAETGPLVTEVTDTGVVYPLADPGPLTAEGAHIYVMEGRRVWMLDSAHTNAPPQLRCELPAVPSRIAVRDGRLYALREGEHQIFVHDLADGRLLRTLGEPGGPYAGPWRPDRLVLPNHLHFAADGSLWVTESRASPKRLTRWDVASGRVTLEKLGSERYGSPGCGMDPERPGRWLGLDAEWQVDWERQLRERITGSLFAAESREGESGRWDVPPIDNRSYVFEHRGDRTFVLGIGSAVTFYELRDHRLIPRALLSTPGIYSHGIGRERGTCAPLVEAYNRAFAAELADPRRRFPSAIYNGRIPMLWVDANGNERLDADEISFPPADVEASIGYWGTRLPGLEFSLQVRRAQRIFLLPFSPLGGTADGRLRYSMEKALADAVEITSPLPAGASAPMDVSVSDRFGRVLTLSSLPYLLAFSPAGRLEWYFRNTFPGVHGSQKAPLPVPGELQGINFALGTAPFSETAEVVALQNNHGRIYFLTTDGVYLDELFDDVRVARARGPGLIGGEAFGGSFAYDRVHGRYILQAGGGGVRVYEIEGLQAVRELPPLRLEVSAEMLLAAAERTAGAAGRDRVPPDLRIPRVAQHRQAMPRLAAWQHGIWQVRLYGGYDAENLYLQYEVIEPSPWVNRGTDPLRLFKTGDCVDFQLAALADPDVPRRHAAIGDVRVLAGGEAKPAPGSAPAARGSGVAPVVALYRYRIPEAEKTAARPAEFASPVQRYVVEDARLPDAIRAGVQRQEQSYRVHLTIPLQELGLQPDTLPGRRLRADFGVIFGDAEGTINVARSYWANPETGLVNDEPGEMQPQPHRWGFVTFEAETDR